MFLGTVSVTVVVELHSARDPLTGPPDGMMTRSIPARMGGDILGSAIFRDCSRRASVCCVAIKCTSATNVVTRIGRLDRMIPMPPFFSSSRKAGF